MLAEYALIVKSPDGVKQAELVGTSSEGFLQLSAAMRVNAAGILNTVVNAENPVVALLEEDSQVEVWRNGRLLFETLYEDHSFQVPDARTNRELFTATCYGHRTLLGRAAIMWPNGLDTRTEFLGMPAEAIMHALVSYNVTSLATVANGRILDFPNPHITVETDQGRGTILSRVDLSGRNLLEELQLIAQEGGIDFDLVRTGNRSWVFRVYDGQLGTNRSASVVFSRSRRNMGALVYSSPVNVSRTVAVVGGAGLDDAREFVVRYGPDYSPSGHREHFEGSGSADTIVALQAHGDRILEERRVKRTLSFDPLQVTGTRFPDDYTLGDLVRASYRDVDATFQVVGATVALPENGQETISVELRQR